MVYVAKEKPYIIAIDFDGTIIKGGWPNVDNGELIWETRRGMEIQLHQNPLTEFVLWTCRSGEKLEDAKRFCRMHALPISYFNEQHPSTFEWMESAAETRKIFAHEYWDDRAVRIGGE